MTDEEKESAARKPGRVAAPRGGFVGPIKRSITIAGHATSISLEPVFWQALEQAARRHALPLSALVAEIDALRIAAPNPPNLASALRTWLADTSCDMDNSYSQ
jgi:predicted DNA-binding ribbon-helix-helix protein